MNGDIKEDSDGTNSDDDVLHSSFTRRGDQTLGSDHKNRRRVFPDKDPFDTDDVSDIDVNFDGVGTIGTVGTAGTVGTVKVHDTVLSAHSGTSRGNSTRNGSLRGSNRNINGLNGTKSEYDEMGYNIAHSAATTHSTHSKHKQPPFQQSRIGMNGVPNGIINGVMNGVTNEVHEVVHSVKSNKSNISKTSIHSKRSMNTMNTINGTVKRHRPSKASSNHSNNTQHHTNHAMNEMNSTQHTPSPNMVSTVISNGDNTRMVHDPVSSERSQRTHRSQHSQHTQRSQVSQRSQRTNGTVNGMNPIHQNHQTHSTHSNHGTASKLNRVVTPVPHKRLQTMTKGRFGRSGSSPPFHAINGMNSVNTMTPIHSLTPHGATHKVKHSVNTSAGSGTTSGTISFSDILNFTTSGYAISGRNDRDRISTATGLSGISAHSGNHSAQSSFLMPSPLHPRPLSPSHTHTDVSVDTVADYELREMPDGGMKRISQSFGVAKEKAVGVILEEQEQEEPSGLSGPLGGGHDDRSRTGTRTMTRRDSKTKASSGVTSGITSGVSGVSGVPLRNAPSVSATDQNASPSPDPTRATPSHDTRRRAHRVSSLGLPPNVAGNALGGSLAGQLVRALSDYNHGQRKRGRSRSRSRNPSQEEQAQFILNVESPHDGDHQIERQLDHQIDHHRVVDEEQDHNRGATDTSMIVEYDEQSVPFEDMGFLRRAQHHHHHHHPHNAGGGGTHSHSSYYTPIPRGASRGNNARSGGSAQQFGIQTKRRVKRFGGRVNAEEMQLVDGDEEELDEEIGNGNGNEMEEEEEEPEEEDGDHHSAGTAASGHHLDAFVGNTSSPILGHDDESGRRYKQFAVRSVGSDTRRNSMESEKLMIHGAGPRFGRGKNSGYFMLRSSRWTRWIALAALSICFVLGVFMGFGVSWMVRTILFSLFFSVSRCLDI